VAEVRRGTRGRQRERRTIVRNPDAAHRALLTGALELFAKQGFAATSVQSIVDSANLTKGAFYHHFESKEDLLLELHDVFIDDQLERAKRVVDAGLPADETLRRLIVEALMEPMTLYQQEITVFLQERRYMVGDAFAEVQAKRDKFEKYFVQVIERGMRDGTFRRSGPARLVAFGVIGMGAWTYVWLDAEGRVSSTELGEMYADILIDGLREPRAAARRRK
jgi:TetR/AcrR family transcriptional regulator, cholesterol catabolism regulator